MLSNNVNVPNVVQISVSRSAERKAIVPAYSTSQLRRDRELSMLRDYIVSDSLGPKHAFDFVGRISPHAVAASDNVLARLRHVHELLGRAFTHVASRWFHDTAAQFPERMPLMPGEEAMLRWISRDESPLLHPQPPLGCWRSDVLFGMSEDGKDTEFPYICEVNGRLPLNGTFMTALHGSGASKLLSDENSDLAVPETLKWPGVDSKILQAAYTASTGQETYVVRPCELEIRPHPMSATGNALWDVSNGLKVEQWICEMLQDEWAAISKTVARQLALTPLNDLRLVLLFHDKRMLGIIKEELPTIVARGVMTPQEATDLAASIPDTFIPASDTLLTLLHECQSNPEAKNSYLYKPCRDGSGNGVELGRNLSQKEWLRRLERLSRPKALRPDEYPAVVQRLVAHHWYDIVRHEVPGGSGTEAQKLHLIGSMFMWDGQRFHLGPWRLGAEVHLGIATGVVMSAIRAPPEYAYDDKLEQE